MRQAGASRISFFLNARSKSVRDYLETEFGSVSSTFLEKDTPNSFETFRLLAGELLRSSPKDAELLISTADSVYRPEELAKFLARARASGAEGALALTSHIDDEKPLWADLDENGRIAAVGDAAAQRKWVTSGFYYLTRGLAGSIPPEGTFPALRHLWSHWVQAGRRIAGIPIGPVVDVDRPEDIAAAEKLLSESSSWQPA